jgi:hypothetical protein
MSPAAPADAAELNQVWQEWEQAVNLSARRLEHWLATDDRGIRPPASQAAT